MNAKPVVVLLFFMFFFILFANAAIGETDLTPNTPPAQGGNNNLSLVQQSGVSSPCRSPYSVQSGDTLSKIAQICSLTLKDLLAVNPSITNPDLIHVDQVIHIPASSAAPAAVQAKPTAVQAQPVVVAPTSTPVPVQVVQEQSQPETTGASEEDLILEAFETASADSASDPIPNAPTGMHPGAEVEISIDDFPANTLVEIGIGQVGQDPVPVGEMMTDARGSVKVKVTIPAQAEAGQKWTVTITSRTDPATQATAVPFTISN